jgi:hypothetical protein
MLSYVVYDLEIERAVPDRRGTRQPGIQYCQGWQDHAGMGVAVVGCYDSKHDRYRAFGAEALGMFAALVEDRDLRVSFNGQAFDDEVLAAAGCVLPPAHHYDLLREVRDALGEARRYEKGYALGSLAGRCLGAEKGGNGALAPVRWQLGHRVEVVDYCLEDVRLTRLLFERVLAGEPLLDARGVALPLRVPEGL